MNLVAKEYCACRIEQDGTLILSQFAGAAEQLKPDALLVNPYDVEQMADCESIPYEPGRARCANEADVAHRPQGECFLVGRFIPCRRIAIDEKASRSPAKSLGTNSTYVIGYSPLKN